MGDKEAALLMVPLPLISDEALLDALADGVATGEALLHPLALELIVPRLDGAGVK